MVEKYMTNLSCVALDPKAFNNFQAEIIEQMNPPEVIEKIKASAGVSWGWDEKLIQDKGKVSNKGKTWEKTGSSNWFTTFGTVVFEKPKLYSWQLNIDSYNKNDMARFTSISTKNSPSLPSLRIIQARSSLLSSLIRSSKSDMYLDILCSKTSHIF